MSIPHLAARGAISFAFAPPRFDLPSGLCYIIHCTIKKDKDCSSCSRECASRQEQQSFQVPGNQNSNVKKVIAVVSGKGGVGKSLVTSLLAAKTRRLGKSTAILDADITGPSIPKAFGVKGQIYQGDEGIYPLTSATGIPVMSLNFFLDDEASPVVWRGPIIAGTVKQFWQDVYWGDVDYMFVDMPPGTGDVPLTVYQSLPISGIVIVTTPQELVGMIVEKAYNMAKLMNIPVLALVENMSYLECPDCGKKIEVFGTSRVEESAAKLGVDCYARIPIDPAISYACDHGLIENVEGAWLDKVVAEITKE